MTEPEFDEFIARLNTASSYIEITSMTDDVIMAFDQRVRMEDYCARRFETMVRQAPDVQFVEMIRQAKSDKRRWTKLVDFTGLVKEEMDFRFLMAKLARPEEMSRAEERSA